MTARTTKLSHLITERDIHAYVDGELMPARRAQVEAYLAIQPEDAARAEFYRAQNIGLHALYDRYAVDSLPISLIAEAANEKGRSDRVGRWPKRLLQSLPAALLVSGLIATLAGHQLAKDTPVTLTASEAFLEDANDVYRRFAANGILNAAGEIQASEARRWLAERHADPRLPIPDLTAVGFEATGGRVVENAGSPAAHLVYRDERGRVVTLHMTKRPSAAAKREAQSALTFLRRDGLSMFYWETGTYGYALIGEFTRKHLVEIAATVMGQLETGAEGETPGIGVGKRRQPQAAGPISAVKAVEATSEPPSARKPALDIDKARTAGEVVPDGKRLSPLLSPVPEIRSPATGSDASPLPSKCADEPKKADSVKPCGPSGA